MHISVLKNEIIEGLDPQKGEVILDGTAGGGGHSLALAQKINGDGTFIFIDQDEDAIKRTNERLGEAKRKIGFIGNFS